MVALVERHNVVANALSRKEVIAYVTTLSKVIYDFDERIKQATKLDACYDRLRQHVKDGATKKYWLEDNLLVAKERKLYVPRGGLRKELL